MCLGLGQAYVFTGSAVAVTVSPTCHRTVPQPPIILIHVNRAQAVCGPILILVVKIMSAHLTHGL